MEIDLPGRGEAVCGAGIQQVTGTVVPAEIADVLDEDVGTLPDLLLDDESGLHDDLAVGIGGREERRKHAAYAPPRAELAGPGELQIRPHASAGDCCRAGRQPHA